MRISCLAVLLAGVCLSAQPQSNAQESAPKGQNKAKTVLQTAAQVGKFKTLINLVLIAELEDEIRNLEGTVFAPTDEAFAKLPAETLASLVKPESRETLRQILLYHVTGSTERLKAGPQKTLGGQTLEVKLSGHDFTVNDGVRVIAANVKTRGGYIQVIDTVLTRIIQVPVVSILPSGHIQVTNTVLTAPAKNDGSIIGVAEKAGFKTLVKLVESAGLTEALATGKNLTVFAPTDEAFAKLPKATLNALAKNPEMLKKVLTVHVVAGRLEAADLLRFPTPIRSLQGTVLAGKLKAGQLQVNEVRVLETDIKAENGIIHIIDAVLLPKE